MYNQYFLKLLNKFNISYLFYLLYKISLKTYQKNRIIVNNFFICYFFLKTIYYMFYMKLQYNK